MNFYSLFRASLVVFLAGVAFAAKPTSDLQPLHKRQLTVTAGERLASRKVPSPVPADLPSPFNPKDFEKPDPADPGYQAPVVTAGSQPVKPVSPPGDRETLETLAAQILPSGMIERGKRLLTIGGKFFEVGTRFVASYSNQEYELELVAIDRTTFTLRYRGEEITRPIKSVSK